MLNTTSTRLMVGVPAASAIVFGLFAVMTGLVSVTEVELAEDEPRVLEKYVYEEKLKDDPRPDRPKPEPIDTPKPPPPPKFANSTERVVVPVKAITGSAPTRIKFTSAKDLFVVPETTIDRDLEVVRPPIANYPAIALQRGIEGDCTVYFDVDVRGRPFNIVPECSDRVFNREARRAISKAEFAPKIYKGNQVVRKNVIYPVSFSLPD